MVQAPHLVDWGYPEERDMDVGIKQYVWQPLEFGVREALQASG